MAVNINALKYIPDLPAASAPAPGDLLHLSQGNIDKQVTLTQIAGLMADLLHPIGSLWFCSVKGKDPNTLFPGQTWVRYAIGESIRGCDAAEVSLGQTQGADTVLLTANMIPKHSHGIGTMKIIGGDHTHTGTTDGGGAHSHTGTTDIAGEHTHTFRRGWDSSTSGPGLSGNQNQSNTGTTNAAGAHFHNLTIAAAPNHTHTFTTSSSSFNLTMQGDTAEFGGTDRVTVIPLTRRVAIWTRTA